LARVFGIPWVFGIFGHFRRNYGKCMAVSGFLFLPVFPELFEVEAEEAGAIEFNTSC
jgi:hypothetical protein